jgi:hypothetical protein
MWTGQTWRTSLLTVGDLFVIFAKADIDILDDPNEQIQVQINWVDVFNPSTGQLHTDEPDNITVGSSIAYTMWRVSSCSRAISSAERHPAGASQDLRQGRDRSGGLGISQQ